MSDGYKLDLADLVTLLPLHVVQLSVQQLPLSHPPALSLLSVAQLTQRLISSLRSHLCLEFLAHSDLIKRLLVK